MIGNFRMPEKQPSGQRINTKKSLFAPFALLVILSMACSLSRIIDQPVGVQSTPEITIASSQVAVVPTQKPVDIPPALVETNPIANSDISVQSPLTFYFNQPMDKASVEAALHANPPISGSFQWQDGATLQFTSDTKLPPATTISFTLDSIARSESGIPLLHPTTITFQTADYLRLTQMLPAPDTSEVNPTSAIVASFNRPVVPLGGDLELQAEAFTLEPVAPGHGTWLNTSTYVFYPDPALSGGTTYQVSVNPALASLDGTSFQAGEKTTWSFTTAVPRLESVQPVTETPWPLDPTVQLKFNQPMDTGSVENHFTMTSVNGKVVKGTYQWNDNETELSFKPSSLLDRGTAYNLVLSGQAAAQGGALLGEDTRIQIVSMPELSISNTQPAQGQVLETDNGYASLTVYFTSPLADKNSLDAFTIRPEIDNFYPYLDSNKNVVYLSGYFQPNTQYTLTISTKLSDQWGMSLPEPFQFTFKTSSFRPSFFVNAQAANQVAFLPPGGTILQLQTTNVHQMDLEMGQIQLDQFFSLTGPNSYDKMNGFQPKDPRRWQQLIETSQDRSQTVNVDLANSKSLPAGIYYVDISSAEVKNYDGGIQHSPLLVVVSPVHLTFKTSDTNVLVWATDLGNQTPVGNAPITIYDEKANAIATGKTDSQGLFQTDITPLENPYQALYAVLGTPEKGPFSIAMSNWANGISGWDFDIPMEWSGPGRKVYLYTDRPIYRPGQTVYFRGIVRNANNGRYTMLDQATLTLDLLGQGQPNGGLIQITDFDLPLSVYGTINGEYTLPLDTPPGTYSFRVADQDNAYLDFQVADYRKPEINLQVSLAPDQIQQGDTLQASVTAQFYTGAPAGNLHIQWNLYRRLEAFQIPDATVGTSDIDWINYLWAFPNPSQLGDLVAQGEETTGQDGKVNLSIQPSQANNDPITNQQRLTLEVTITDDSGFTVSQRATAYLHPDSVYLGIRPDTWTGQSDKEMGFTIVSVGWDKMPVAANDLVAEFQKVKWVEDLTATQNEFGAPRFKPDYTPIASTNFATDATGQARLAFTPPDPGTYQIEVKNGKAQSLMILWVSGPGQAIWPNLPNQHLKLTADAISYTPGDTAQVFIPNPFAQATSALVSRERSRIMQAEIVEIPPEGLTLKVPLSGEDAPNIYLAVTLIGKDQGKFDFRQGFINLQVKPQNLTLSVTLNAQPERTQPGEEIQISLQASDSSGKPVQGEFSLAVVDQAALALADPNATDILSSFYDNQPLGVQTALDLAISTTRTFLSPPGLGGGGGGDFMAPVITTRENFPDTAFWSASIVTDQNGLAETTVKLPDNLTTWQVDLRGITMDSQVGQAVSQVITTKDLYLQPVTPRFLVAGDHIQLGAIVHNNTADDLAVEVGLDASGFTLDDPDQTTLQISVPAHGRMQVNWWGTAQPLDSANLVFSAKAGSYQDRTQPSQGNLPILSYTAPQAFSTTGQLDQAGTLTEVVSLPRTFTPIGSELQVEAAPSLAGAMIGALDVLENSDSANFTEPTLSRFLPNVEAYLALQSLGLSNPSLESRLDQTLNEGITRLVSLQNQDGGWGWTNNKDSDPLISAYVLFGISRAQKAGIQLDPTIVDHAQTYLISVLPDSGMVKENWELDRMVFQYFALQQSGVGDMGNLGTLYEMRSQLSPWAQALLALTIEGYSKGDSRTQTLLSDMQAGAILSASSTHWETQTADWQNLSTSVQASAVVVYAIAQLDPASTLLPGAVRYLMAHRNASGEWQSTYETAWVIMALSQTLQGTGDLQASFDYSAILNGTPILNGQASGPGSLSETKTSIPLPLGTDTSLLEINRGAGTGQLYYRATLLASRPAEQAPAVSQGVTIERTYQTCVKTDCQSAKGMRLATGGQRTPVSVQVTVTLSQDTYYLVVEDWIPSGMEIYNTNLKTSEQGLTEETQTGPLYDSTHPYASGWGWWYFDNPKIYTNHITWVSDYLPAGTYTLTYTLLPDFAGEFQVLPAHAWQYYFPEVQGTSAGELFKILP